MAIEKVRMILLSDHNMTVGVNIYWERVYLDIWLESYNSQEVQDDHVLLALPFSQYHLAAPSHPSSLVILAHLSPPTGHVDRVGCAVPSVVENGEDWGQLWMEGKFRYQGQKVVFVF